MSITTTYPIERPKMFPKGETWSPGESLTAIPYTKIGVNFNTVGFPEYCNNS